MTTGDILFFMVQKKPTYGDWFSYPRPRTPEEEAKLKKEFEDFDRGLKFVGGKWIQTNINFQL